MIVGLAQVDVTVGDLAGNVSTILAAIDAARDQDVQLLAFPELAVSGYPPEDLLLREDFLADCSTAAERIARASGEMLATRCRDNLCAVAYCNLVGGQDELVFDGGSMVLDHEGRVVARAGQYTEALLVVDVDLDRPRSARLHDTRFRTAVLAETFSGLEPDIAEENLQARARGNLLMAMSNKFGWLLLTTGNKSEMSVGYATLYGDMAGGYAVLKDVPKQLVFALTRWRNRDGAPVPQRIIERPPSAELRADQRDSDSLPPYEVLDPILHRYVEEDDSPQAIVGAGFDPEVVGRVVGLVDRAEYKRRQAPPGIKITSRAFGRDRRMPVVNRFRGRGGGGGATGDRSAPQGPPEER